MSLIRSAKHFLGKTGRERSLAFRNRWRAALSSILFGVMGRWTNRPGSAFLLVARPDFDYDFGRFPEFRELHRAWKFEAEGNNGSDVTRLFMLCQNLSQVSRDGIPGDFVEVGVYKGNSAKVLHRYARRDGRHLYLFDTFSGFDRSDMTGVDQGRRHQGFVDTSLRRVQEFVGSDGVTYVAGSFPTSAATAECLPESVAVLHVDCDLYAPMKAALEFFYPLMSKGGLIALHDYGSTHWPGATQAIDEFFRDKPERIIVMPDKSGTAAARKV